MADQVSIRVKIDCSDFYPNRIPGINFIGLNWSTVFGNESQNQKTSKLDLIFKCTTLWCSAVATWDFQRTYKLRERICNYISVGLRVC